MISVEVQLADAMKSGAENVSNGIYGNKELSGAKFRRARALRVDRAASSFWVLWEWW